MSVTVTFLGAAGTVTGSKYLVESGSQKLLIDGGMFQGDREWRERNWESPGIDLGSINCVLLTHAHIDHTGILPRFYRLGLRCPILATPTTTELSRLLLLDAGRLQEEESDYRSKEEDLSRHHPPLPLYTLAEAEQTLTLFQSRSFDQRHEVIPGVFAQWYRAGHIVGAASLRLEIGGKTIVFSGDIGRYNVPILHDPETPPFGDLLLIESTYGDRLHSKEDSAEQFARIVRETAARKGVVLIPSFAVGRCQQLLFDIRRLKEAKLIPDIPVVIDSPMASKATALYAAARDEFDHEARELLRQGKEPFSFSKLYFTKSREESIKLNSVDEPMIIISANGMLSGGRILHHLKNRVGDPRNTVLFVGYQPAGGRGDWLKRGNKSMRLLGKTVAVRAAIEEISALSAHGDQEDLLRWCRSSSGTESPGRVAVVHGEPSSASAFADRLKVELGWHAAAPAYRERYTV